MMTLSADLGAILSSFHPTAGSILVRTEGASTVSGAESWKDPGQNLENALGPVEVRAGETSTLDLEIP
jgi:hypothetical protein